VHSTATYSPRRCTAAKAALCIAGDSECDIGEPITAAIVVMATNLLFLPSQH
jgi:hypothetical protein